MNRILVSAMAIAATIGLAGCCNTATERALTPETRNMLDNLKTIGERGVMYGHQDDVFYGIGWQNEEGRSDVKSVCGDYPAVMGYDIGRIEHGADKNLDGVEFSAMKKAIIDTYNRGGVNTISWHPDNPVTGGNSWDVGDGSVVASLLSGGENEELYVGWLNNVAGFFLELKTDDGTKVPVIFRPFHEHTGSWFWWGKTLCSREEYVALWHHTHDYLTAKGVDNIVWAYSPDFVPDSEEYFERYPGDEYVDILGFDFYHHDQSKGGIANYKQTIDNVFSFLTAESRKRGMPLIFSETGAEGVPNPRWWTEVLLDGIEGFPIAYVLTWRNAHDKPGHFYGPYPGSVSADNFVEFYNSPRTLFESDIKGAVYSKQ